MWFGDLQSLELLIRVYCFSFLVCYVLILIFFVCVCVCVCFFGSEAYRSCSLAKKELLYFSCIRSFHKSYSIDSFTTKSQLSMHYSFSRLKCIWQKISFLVLGILTFSIMQIRSVMTSYCLQPKMVKHWINNISRNIKSVFLKLGPINVHHKRNKMAPLMLLP